MFVCLAGKGPAVEGDRTASMLCTGSLVLHNHSQVLRNSISMLCNRSQRSCNGTSH